MPVGSVLSFSENSFMPLALCYFFRDSYIPSALKRNKFQTLGILTSTVWKQSKAHLMA